MTNIVSITQIVQDFGKALTTGDIPTAFSLFSSDVRWHQPGDHKFSGTKSGIDEIGQMLGGMMQDVNGTLKLAPTSALMQNDNLVAMPLRFSAEKGEKSIDMIGVDLYEVVDGKIAQVWLFSEDQEEENAFWGK